ncbi:MAG: methyl-accepting chemotaxis protein [Pseudomonadota bacterium]
MMFPNVNISTRVVAAFVSLVLLTAIVSGFSIFRVSGLQASLATINDFNSVKQRYAINFRGSVHDRAISVRDVVLVEDQAGLDRALAEIRTLKAAYDASAGPMDEMFRTSPGISEEERTILGSIKEIERVTVPLYEEVVRLQLAGQAAEARTLLINDASPNFSEWLARINRFIDLQEEKNATIKADVDEKVMAFSAVVLGILLLGGVLSLAMGIWCAAALRSLKPLTEKMQLVADGNLDTEIPCPKGENEVANMAKALQFFRENLKRTKVMDAENEQRAAEMEADKRRSMNDMADGFEANVESVVTAVSRAAETMVSLADTLSSAAKAASDRSSEVASASQEATSNVQTVAAASEEITNSLAEVSQRVSQSAEMTDGAARKTVATTETVSKLSTSAQTIGDVISMISDIAEQTNLLALNATIEAARAGEAGKGFAVVASEVKGLASQTAKATEQISKQITGMQADTTAVVDAIGEIGGMIEDLNTGSASIAAAVEEQHASTQEIARNTQHAADGTEQVTANIGEVSAAISETEQAASEVKAASSQLATEANRLRESVQEFLGTVRAA